MDVLDEARFTELSERHRRELQVHSYRMLGNLEQAEDAVQEALLRAWKGRASFDGGPAARAWLYRIVSTTCFDILRAAKRRPEQIESIADVPWLQPYPDALLDAAALDAVRQWVFTPTTLNGQPVPVIMTVTVNFTLQ